jgi:hypothetical protein
VARALVVFESMFGNTGDVARAVGDGLARHMPVDVVEVGVAPVEPAGDVTLLVVGGPTHAFGLSRSSTRREAAGRRAFPPLSSGIGVREWLAEFAPRPGLSGAAFATRTAQAWVPGSAGNAIGRRLGHRGVPLVAPACSFHVTGMEGPLADGELNRARRWGEELAAALSVHVTRTR